LRDASSCLYRTIDEYLVLIADGVKLGVQRLANRDTNFGEFEVKAEMGAID
jgi:hypothetical protein